MSTVSPSRISHSALRVHSDPGPSLFKAWTSSFLVYFYPGATSRRWVVVSPVKAAFVAAINLCLALPLALLVTVSCTAWTESRLRVKNNFNGDFIDAPAREFLKLFGTVPSDIAAFLSHLNFFEKAPLFGGIIFIITAAFAMTFFLLLPFAARPGSGKACIKHVLRTVFLGTGFIFIWAPILSAEFILFIVYRYGPFLDIVLGHLVITVSVLILWSFAVLVTAARREYRTPADYPKPRDPTCDLCGYDLIASDANGRCPECGRLVQDSIGPSIRPPTTWESRPSPINLPAIRRQLANLILRPRKTYLLMPTLTGQPAAHRWLLYSLLFIAGAASLIVPGIWFLIYRDVGFSMNVVWGGIIVGLVWALLGLMMVGIETAGIAAFSRMKGHPVYLAAAAKVTAYSSPLMLLWVLLGGLQLLLTLYLWDSGFWKYHRYSFRVEQIYIALSLSFAHIGGLLWYELTVYRGIRSIQYANK